MSGISPSFLPLDLSALDSHTAFHWLPKEAFAGAKLKVSHESHEKSGLLEPAYRFVGFSKYKVIASENRRNDNEQLHRGKVTAHASTG